MSAFEVMGINPEYGRECLCLDNSESDISQEEDVVHLLETNVSRSMLRALLHTVDVDVGVNRPDRQGWTDNHDECVWQRDSDKSY